jgi:hypothetical protein
VTHVEDFENGVLYSNVTIEGTIYNFVDTIVGEAPKSIRTSSSLR